MIALIGDEPIVADDFFRRLGEGGAFPGEEGGRTPFDLARSESEVVVMMGGGRSAWDENGAGEWENRPAVNKFE